MLILYNILLTIYSARQKREHYICAIGVGSVTVLHYPTSAKKQDLSAKTATAAGVLLRCLG